MHILIIEAALTGHHSGYLERIVESFLKENHYVSVSVLENDMQHEALARLSRKFDGKLRLIPVDSASYRAALNSRLGEPGRELALRSMFGRVYRATERLDRVDYVFIPYLDYCLYAIGLLGSPFGETKWGGICMRPSFHYKDYGVVAPKPRIAKLKSMLFLRLLRSKKLNRIYTIDELLNRFVGERHGKLSGKIRYAPDPATLIGNKTYKSARQFLKIPENIMLVLAYGAIDERKGVDALIAAVEDERVPRDIHVLVAGRQSQSLAAQMRGRIATELKQQGRLHVVEGFVDEETEQAVFAAADVVWLGYRNHFAMSGVMVQAAAAGSRIIATQDGLIGWYARCHGEEVVDINSNQQIVDALSRLSEFPNRLKGGRVEVSKFSNHTWDNFLRIICHN